MEYSLSGGNNEIRQCKDVKEYENELKRLNIEIYRKQQFKTFINKCYFLTKRYTNEKINRSFLSPWIYDQINRKSSIENLSDIFIKNYNDIESINVLNRTLTYLHL